MDSTLNLIIKNIKEPKLDVYLLLFNMISLFNAFYKIL